MGNSLLFVLLTCFLLTTQTCLLHANKHRFLADCRASGFLKGRATNNCNTQNDSECCVANKSYPKYDCLPAVTGSMRARMTLNSFAQGGDGGDASACDGRFHTDTETVVALSTGWYNHGSPCNRNIRINGNGRSVLAKVVDECDSMHGCDAPHAFQPPCANNVVDASPAMWKKLGYSGDAVGDANITWSDA